MASKVSLEELQKMMADPAVDYNSLKQYFRENPERSGPFAPSIEVDPDAVIIPDNLPPGARSALLLNGANWISMADRQARFNQLLASGYDGPILAEEGDSWFQYPVRLHDVIDVLMEKYAVLSYSAAGDTLDNMAAKKQYLKALKSSQAPVLLLSAGGNDLVAGGNLAKHLLHPTGLPADPAAYLASSFDTLLMRAIGKYEQIFRDISSTYPDVSVVCHGYDYVVPNQGRWIGTPMEVAEIHDTDLQNDIARVMVDRFNDYLSAAAARYTQVEYIDLRNTVGEDGWYDELHPLDSGYRAVADRIDEKIIELINTSRGTTRGSRAVAKSRSDRQPTPTARSLHVGVNKADQDHYLGLLPDLSFCVADADAMHRIAKDRGYETTTLNDNNATRDAVKSAISAAAQDLVAGDIFMFTYAGHGGQVRDYDRDEADGPDNDTLDETICLFDGQLLDDELWQSWSEFNEGVRIVAVFDSCHSGTVVRASGTRNFLHTATVSNGLPRAMPLQAAARINREHKEYYRSIGFGLPAQVGVPVVRERDFPIKASLLQLSACQSNQLAYETLGNGRFTSELLNALDRNTAAISGGYEPLMETITAGMPSDQTPRFWRRGPRNPHFEAQYPFDIR